MRLIYRHHAPIETACNACTSKAIQAVLFCPGEAGVGFSPAGRTLWRSQSIVRYTCNGGRCEKLPRPPSARGGFSHRESRVIYPKPTGAGKIALLSLSRCGCMNFLSVTTVKYVFHVYVIFSQSENTSPKRQYFDIR